MKKHKVKFNMVNPQFSNIINETTALPQVTCFQDTWNNKRHTPFTSRWQKFDVDKDFTFPTNTDTTLISNIKVKGYEWFEFSLFLGDLCIFTYDKNMACFEKLDYKNGMWSINVFDYLDLRLIPALISCKEKIPIRIVSNGKIQIFAECIKCYKSEHRQFQTLAYVQELNIYKVFKVKDDRFTDIPQLPIDLVRVYPSFPFDGKIKYNKYELIESDSNFGEYELTTKPSCIKKNDFCNHYLYPSIDDVLYLPKDSFVIFKCWNKLLLGKDVKFYFTDYKIDVNNVYPFTKLSETVYLEGFWRSIEDITLPFPLETDKVVDSFFLNKLKSVIETCEKESYYGYSECRLCNIRNGSLTYILKLPNGIEWRFPEGLLHYYTEHNVQPSVEFRDMILLL